MQCIYHSVDTQSVLYRLRRELLYIDLSLLWCCMVPPPTDTPAGVGFNIIANSQLFAAIKGDNDHWCYAVMYDLYIHGSRVAVAKSTNWKQTADSLPREFKPGLTFVTSSFKLRSKFWLPSEVQNWLKRS